MTLSPEKCAEKTNSGKEILCDHIQTIYITPEQQLFIGGDHNCHVDKARDAMFIM